MSRFFLAPLGSCLTLSLEQTNQRTRSKPHMQCSISNRASHKKISQLIRPSPALACLRTPVSQVDHEVTSLSLQSVVLCLYMNECMVLRKYVRLYVCLRGVFSCMYRCAFIRVGMFVGVCVCMSVLLRLCMYKGMHV